MALLEIRDTSNAQSVVELGEEALAFGLDRSGKVVWTQELISRKVGEVRPEDGRYFLETTERRFDLITAEPPPPVLAGVVNLYTREYFELIHSRLREGGFASYWLPVKQMEARAAKAITAAFCGAFEDVPVRRPDHPIVRSASGVPEANLQAVRAAVEQL